MYLILKLPQLKPAFLSSQLVIWFMKNIIAFLKYKTVRQSCLIVSTRLEILNNNSRETKVCANSSTGKFKCIVKNCQSNKFLLLQFW